MEVFARLRGEAGYIELHKSTILIGRSTDCDLSFDLRSLSNHHAKLLLEGPTNSAVIDLNSRNGTYVNNIRVKNESVPVYHGDTLRFGVEMVPFLLEFPTNGTSITKARPNNLCNTHTTTGVLTQTSTLADSLPLNTAIAHQDKRAANTWFSQEDTCIEEFPILNIAQHEYKAAIKETISTQPTDDLSELTIPSHYVTLDVSHSHSSVQASELSTFLQWAWKNLSACSTRDSYYMLINDLLERARSLCCSERSHLISILEYLRKIVAEKYVDASTLTDLTTSQSDPRPLSDLTNDDLEAAIYAFCSSDSKHEDFLSELSSLRQALSKRDQYERLLLERLSNYKTAVSLLKDDLFKFLSRHISSLTNCDETFLSSMVDNKLNGYFLQESLRKMDNKEDHISLLNTVDLLNERISELVEENMALKAKVDKKQATVLSQTPHISEADIIRILVEKLQTLQNEKEDSEEKGP